MAQSHTPCNRCVRFATTVASGNATLATKRTLLLTWAGLAPAGSHQLAAGALIPINNISLGTLPAERVKNASGLYNLTRNLGGAVGLAGLTTILNDRTDLHLARLHEAATWSRPAALEALNNLVARFHGYGSDAQAMPLKQLNLMTHQQGVVMAFADVFFLLTLLFLGLAALAIVMKRPAAAAGAVGGH